MTAVVRPVSVYNLYFRFSGISLLTLEIIAHESKILHGHSKSHFCVIFCDLPVRIVNKTVKRFNVFGFNRNVCKRLGLVKRHFFAFYGVDNMFFYGFKLLRIRTLNGVYRCALYKRTFLLREKLNALCGAVRTLVVLSR